MTDNPSARIYRVDKFKVPPAAREEFLARVRETHAILRVQPGLVDEFLLERAGGPGTFNFVTVAIWRDADAIENARAAVDADRARSGFDPAQMLERLGIEADLANYTRVE